MPTGFGIGPANAMAALSLLPNRRIPIAHHQYTFEVPTSAIDENGHVNNVEYVRWMQEAATAHATATGAIAKLVEFGATWVVRDHRITYLKPAMEGELIGVQTWIENYRRVRSCRKYRFIRLSDMAVLAHGETDWIFVNIATGKPMAIPESIQTLFTLVPDETSVPTTAWD